MIKRGPTKSVRVVPPMIEEQEVNTVTLQEWLDRKETVSHLLLYERKEEGINESYKSFKNCTFQHQAFSERRFRSFQLTDVRFEDCDLPNISFTESSLCQIGLTSYELLGIDLSEATMNHVLLHDCDAGYINPAMSKTNRVHLVHSQLRNRSLSDCRFSSIAFESRNLVEADFPHVPLRRIDLHTSHISEITLSTSDLKGAVITSL